MQRESDLRGQFIHIHVDNAKVVADLTEMFLLVADPLRKQDGVIGVADPHGGLLKWSGAEFPKRDVPSAWAFDLGRDTMRGVQVARQNADAFDLVLG